MMLLHDSSEKIVHCLAWCAIITTDPTVRSLALLQSLGALGFRAQCCHVWHGRGPSTSFEVAGVPDFI